MNKLMNSVVAGTILAAVGAALVPMTAHAQTPATVNVQKPIRVKIGAAFQTDGNKDSVFNIGGDYDFGKNTGTNPNIYSFYADYYGKGSQNVFGGGIGLRHLLGSPLTSAQPYVGGGIGVYSTKMDIAGSSTQTNLGGKLLAGYQLNEGFFGEVDYTILHKNRDNSPNAIGLRVGYRF